MTDGQTYRERRLAKAERLRDWAEKRDGKADAAKAGVDSIADRIPFGQPILVGHHSERGARRDQDRIHNGMRSYCDNVDKADDFRSRADNIEAAADNAIYSDDADAVERLAAKVASLEAQRDSQKQANAAFRKENRELLKGMTAYQRDQTLPFPAWSITNLTGNIGRARKRLEGLERERTNGPADRIITARFASSCELCGADLVKGQTIRYNRVQGARCVDCETR